MHQSIPPAPSPHPLGYCGAFARLVSPGGGALRCPAARGQPRASGTHAVSYQNIITLRIRQGWEKIEEVCKGMFSILCMHFLIAYKARIT